LKNTFNSGNYNFYYAAMEVNRNNPAADQMFGSYNLITVPSCYFGGGRATLLGATMDTTYYASRIRSCGSREVPDLDLDISMTWLGNFQMEVTVTLTSHYFVNSAPDAPAAPAGPAAGLLEDEHQFSAMATDLDGDQLYYMWDWGDMQTDWLGPYNSGETIDAFRTWSTAGTYPVAVKAKDIWDAETAWSTPSEVIIVARGDANGDGQANVGDAVFMIGYVFKGGDAPVPTAAGDANCDGQPNVGDAVYLIGYVFKGGPAPGCPE